MSHKKAQISPREIYEVFSLNLTKLVESSSSSVTRICQEIGVNRTQFNRYLSGQANPRPDVLHKICRHFKVDARILLEPLKGPMGNEDQSSERWMSDSPFRNFIFGRQDRLNLSVPIPLGIHRYWQRSSLHSDWVNSYTIRIFDMGGATVFRAVPDRRNDKVLGQYTSKKKGEIRGFFMSQVDGVVMVGFKNDSQRISMSYLTAITPDSPVMPGIVMLTRPELAQATRIERCALEFLNQKPGLRANLRDRCGRLLSELPEFIAHGLRGKVR
ncbi:helix-turn-helix transcriptional regulator [Aliiroseovarius sp. KMU-50]|uniref:Helix-turn-helix transcriptional regulator n=1 Tax=Aliiroseovarius salicola TaxID=3009082 RepID=A0ABT4W382_9RHOB|nr:helix-turn-helix transcriptional regulator [Aliiroseovarius sp. KMU-50]MDA5094973.1 helix-turn-helix transcriptional regulator [Aliiroseovarius sp. KMU-50]